MKFLKITTLYPTYIQYFFSKHPDLYRAPYHTQKSSLDYDAHGWIDSWSHALTPLGYDVMDIQANVKPLQTAWAREQHISYRKRSWMRDIASAQIYDFKPEIIFIQTEALLSAQWLLRVLKNITSVKLLIAWIGSPINNIENFSKCDFVLTCIPEKIEKFKKAGIECYHFNHAFDPRILERLGRHPDPEIDISFIGQIVRSSRFHLGRDSLLRELITGLDITIYSPSSDVSSVTWIRYYIQNILHPVARLFQLDKIDKSILSKIFSPDIIRIITERPISPITADLTPYLRLPVYGLDMYETLVNSKITLNTHIDVSPRSASNMRLFESTGVGTCLLTDWKDNLPDLFDPDKEVVTYKSAEECKEKAKWLLDHPQERRAIAAAGQQRTLADHTFTQRAQQLDELIRKKV
jgi:spore maturation protein CgeB